MTRLRDTMRATEHWEAMSLRATMFHNLPTPELPRWWQEVSGSKPEQIVTRPTEHITQLSGGFEGAQMTLTAWPNRVDWSLQAMPAAQGQPIQGFPTLGAFPDAPEPFLKIVRKWLNVVRDPFATRLAFGAVLVRQAADLSTAYNELSQFLPKVQLDPAGSSDFLYQINRPRKSRSGTGFRINRLTKWSVVQGRYIAFGATMVGEPTPTSVPPQSACRLELDINTPAEISTPIPRDEAGVLFEELVELGSEIAAKGDVP